MKQLYIMLIGLLLLTTGCAPQLIEIDTGKGGACADAPRVVVMTPTNNVSPTWYWNISGAVKAFRCRLNNESWVVLPSVTTTYYTSDIILGEGEHTLEVQALGTDGRWSKAGSAAVTIDIDPPVSPDVTGDAITADTRPIWSWRVSDETVLVRYRLDEGVWITDDQHIGTYSPDTPLDAGDHTLEVQAMDSVGNWSASGTRVITIDLSLPESPEVDGISPTNRLRPQWTWSLPDNCVSSKYRLNNGEWITVEDPDTTSFTPDVDLFAGRHTLEVQVQNNLGTWSLSGTKTVTIDLSPPDAPYVSGDSPVNNTRPLWTWIIPDDTANIRYRLNYGEWVVTNDITRQSYIPTSPLSGGNYILEVQAADYAGNWSDSGKKLIYIDLIPPAQPVVSGAEITADLNPIWEWDVPLYTHSFRYRLDRGLWQYTTDVTITSYTPDATLSPGTHLFEVQACDSVGNYSIVGSYTTMIQ